MKQVPSYGKILTLGQYRTEDALNGVVLVQEKLDGSFFAFGINDEGQTVCRSKNNHLVMEHPEQMFTIAVNVATALGDAIRSITNETDIYFYCEYLNKPKHGVLTYARVPNMNLMLFDVLREGRYLSPDKVAAWAKALNISYAPCMIHADGVTKEDLVKLLDTDSFLGGEKIEGVVIKNYSKTIVLGGQPMPLITKFVRPDFKERNDKNWKEQKSFNLTEYVATFCSENRWQKALQHLKESGQLVNEPKDIGAICKEVQRDLEEEEKETIKEELYAKVRKDLQRVCVRGVAEWYKNILMNGTENTDISIGQEPTENLNNESQNPKENTNSPSGNELQSAISGNWKVLRAI